MSQLRIAGALFLVLVCFGPSRSVEAYPGRELAPGKIVEEIALLRQALERIHPGYERFASREELAARWDELATLSETGGTDVELLVGVSRLLATVRCDHTIAELPEDLARWREETPSYLPVRLEFIADRALVMAADPEQPGLARGQEIVAIDGRPIREVVDEILPLISVDGDTDHVKDMVLGYSTEYQGGALDHFLPLLRGFQDSFVLAVESDGEVREVVARALTYDAWMAMAAEGERYRNFKDEVEFRWLDDDVGYLSIGTFVNYRKPADPRKLLRPIFKELAARDARRLIVDLRDNGGGSTEPAMALLRYLMAEPFVWARPSRLKTLDVGTLRPHLSTWDDSAFDLDPADFIERGAWYEFKREQAPKPTEPYRERFGGDVVVLVGPANSSGSTHLVAKLKDSGRVRLVGQPMGGSPTGVTAGLIFFLELPHSGIVVRVPAIRTVLNVKSFTEGEAVAPDVLVPVTAETLLDGVDQELAVARALD